MWQQRPGPILPSIHTPSTNSAHSPSLPAPKCLDASQLSTSQLVHQFRPFKIYRNLGREMGETEFIQSA